jgi:Sulfotransferase family
MPPSQRTGGGFRLPHDDDAAPIAPIFLGGTGRSGKTLVRWMLSSHPRIVVSRRTEMWPRFAGRFGDLGRPENLQRCLDAMLARKQIAELQPDVERLRTDLAQGTPTYARLFALIHEQYAERSGKQRWGDQSAGVESFAEEIFTAYPGARMIHMVRDPRDAYVALLDKGLRRTGAVGRATASWMSSVGLAERNAARHPESYRIVRYEDLVAAPLDAMRAVCGFLGETFDPAIVRMEGAHRYDALRAASPDGIPVSTAYVGGYRGTIAPADLAFIQRAAATPMASLGYAADPVRLSTFDRLRGAVTWPVSRARMGAAT